MGRGSGSIPDGDNCEETGRLEVIPHADHFFGRGLTEMGKTVAAWLRGDRPELMAPSDEGATAVKPLEFDLDPGDAKPLELEEDPE